MKKVKQKNNWIIKVRTKGDMYYNSNEDKNYVVCSPDGIIMEDRLSYDQAIEFCTNNLDHVTKTSKHNEEEQFAKSVKDGKWFKVNDNTIVKIKSIGRSIISLWLSNQWDEMCYTEYKENDWDIRNNKICTYQGHTYHFGEQTGENDDIYDENGMLNDEKLINSILNASENKNYKLISSEELTEMWNNLKNKSNINLDNINFV